MKYFDLLHFYPLKLQFEGLFNTQTTYFKAKICIYDIFCESCEQISTKLLIATSKCQRAKSRNISLKKQKHIIIKQFSERKNMENDKYLHPEFETMSRQEIESLQLTRLKKTINQCMHSEFYKKRFEENGLKPEDIQSLEDLKKSHLLQNRIFATIILLAWHRSHLKKL